MSNLNDLNEVGDRNLAAALWAVMQEERFEDFDGLDDRQREFWIEQAQRLRTLLDVLTAGPRLTAVCTAQQAPPEAGGEAGRQGRDRQARPMTQVTAADLRAVAADMRRTATEGQPVSYWHPVCSLAVADWLDRCASRYDLTSAARLESDPEERDWYEPAVAVVHAWRGVET